jgi:hypothetical protein
VLGFTLRAGATVVAAGGMGMRHGESSVSRFKSDQRSVARNERDEGRESATGRAHV